MPNLEKPDNISKQKKPFILGSVSRLHKDKNIDQLIRIFDALTYKYPHLNVQLKIYGDGKELNKLQEYAQAFSCANNVYFLGYEKNTKKIFSEIDSLISFSQIEGFGISILESLNYKKPVFHVACPCGPSELLVPHKNNIILQDALYTHSQFGFLVDFIGNTTPYATKINENEEMYIEILKEFIDFYITNDINKYDFNIFMGSVITDEWMQVISNALEKKIKC